VVLFVWSKDAEVTRVSLQNCFRIKIRLTNGLSDSLSGRKRSIFRILLLLFHINCAVMPFWSVLLLTCHCIHLMYNVHTRGVQKVPSLIQMDTIHVTDIVSLVSTICQLIIGL